MQVPDQFDLLVIGGGAAGYFGAIMAAEHATRPLRIAILEQGKSTLQKVRISGGGRCNVTHAAFNPRELVAHYPRGERELLGPFTKFAPGDTMDWFERQGVSLKIEEDGRVFPQSDASSSIIDALQKAVSRHRISVRTSTKVTAIERNGDDWVLFTKSSRLSAKRVLLATGSAPAVYKWIRKLQLALVDPVPSLFTFKVHEPELHKLQGLSVVEAQVELPEERVSTRGPLLITHWGMSGPAILRASAEAAVGLHHKRYKTGFRVSWTHSSIAEAVDYLRSAKPQAAGHTLAFSAGLALPKRLWSYLVARSGLATSQRWAALTKQELTALATTLASDGYLMTGQSRFKAEFVTAGGINLKEIDFRRFSIRKHEGLYAAGELLDIDGVTGGFNFQAAWTGGFLAGKAIAASLA